MNPTLAVAEAESPRRLRAAARSATDEAASTPAASDATSANSFETLTSGGVAWEIVPAWRDLLAGDEGLPIERWLRERNAFVFKHGAGRTVYRVDLAERSFFIKHHRTRGLFKTIKDFFREGACRREYRRARELAERGVPATRPLAVGETGFGLQGRDSYLVTEAIPDACSIDEYLALRLPSFHQAKRADLRVRLIEAAARLCAVAHRAGVFHRDLHGGNILIAHASRLATHDETPQLYLADLPSVGITGPLDFNATRDSLAMICSGFLNRMSESDRRRFWKEYLRARPELKIADAERSGREVREAAFAYARRMLRRRDKRAWTDNRDYYRLQTEVGTAHAVRDIPRTTIERLLEHPERLWKDNVDRPVKLSRGSVVVEAELPVEDREIHVAVKRLRPKTWTKMLSQWFRRGRAPEAWYRGHALLARDIPTARPLAVYGPRSSDFRRDEYLLTEWLTGALDLHLYGWDLARRDADVRRRSARRSAEALGRLVGRLHDQGFSHRDLKGNNILLRDVAQFGGGDKAEAFLIDLDGLRRQKTVSFGTCCKNLTRLALSVELHPWVSQTDRLRFLRSYLKRMPENRRTWKTWWRTVERHLAGELERIRATGKSVS